MKHLLISALVAAPVTNDTPVTASPATNGPIELSDEQIDMVADGKIAGNVNLLVHPKDHP
jgi:hypothetical protein